MSSPFQRAFSSRSPLNEIKISQKELNNPKSASPEPAKQIGYEGQGGIDYENLPSDAINPEGQGGKDYEADDSMANMNYEADDSVAKMNSPLDKAGARGNHGNHMREGADNSGNPNAATPGEYWRVHQQQRHHRTPPKGDEKKKLKA
jgi:hypothetical protein